LYLEYCLWLTFNKHFDSWFCSRLIDTRVKNQLLIDFLPHNRQTKLLPGLHRNRGHLSVCKLHWAALRHLHNNAEADESSGHEPSITLCGPVVPLLQLLCRDVPAATVCGGGCHNTLQFAGLLLLDVHHIFRRVENYKKTHKKLQIRGRKFRLPVSKCEGE
jgi:hypothetical protein